MENKLENEVIISVDHVGMRFRMSNDRISSVKEMVTQMLKGKLKYSEFWALKDVSLDRKSVV